MRGLAAGRALRTAARLRHLAQPADDQIRGRLLLRGRGATGLRSATTRHDAGCPKTRPRGGSGGPKLDQHRRFPRRQLLTEVPAAPCRGRPRGLSSARPGRAWQGPSQDRESWVLLRKPQGTCLTDATTWRCGVRRKERGRQTSAVSKTTLPGGRSMSWLRVPTPAPDPSDRPDRHRLSWAVPFQKPRAKSPASDSQCRAVPRVYYQAGAMGPAR